MTNGISTEIQFGRHWHLFLQDIVIPLAQLDLKQLLAGRLIKFQLLFFNEIFFTLSPLIVVLVRGDSGVLSSLVFCVISCLSNMSFLAITHCLPISSFVPHNLSSLRSILVIAAAAAVVLVSFFTTFSFRRFDFMAEYVRFSCQEY